MLCNAQKDYYNNKTEKVEVDPESYIQYSVIASEWMRLADELRRKDSIIEAKEEIIQEMARISKNRLSRIEQLTDVIINKSREIDGISEEQVDLARDMLSRFKLRLEFNTLVHPISDFRIGARLEYDIKKVYIFTNTYAGNNNFMEVRLGIGYNIF
jgi:hypothetical protein